MQDVLFLLVALKLYCKDTHYAFYGVDFKSLHEWADEIAEPVDSFVDEILENYYMAKGVVIPRSYEMYKGAFDFIPTALGSNDRMLANLQAILSMLHNKVNGINEEAGINDLMGRIDCHLLKHLALINMAIINKAREE